MTLFVLLIACSSSPTPSPEDETPVDSGDPDTGNDSDCPDESAVRALIDGTATLDETRFAVAWSEGWPVRTCSETWLFIADGSGRTLAGDHSDWTEIAMTEGSGFSWAEVAVGSPAGSGYKLGPGLAADPWARSYDYDAFGEISFVAPPSDAPRLDRWPELQAEGLAARDLRVFVPPGAGPFDVLYAHDGQNLFDPNALWGGWRLQTALAEQPPMLVVGIDNTLDRANEYTHVYDAVLDTGGGGAAYARLVHDHVRPHIEATYGSTGTDGLLGSSLGGLVSLVVADADPTAWDFVGSLSGTLGWGKLGSDNELIVERWEQAPRGPVIYVDSGGSAGLDGCTDPNGDGYPVDDPDDSDNYCANRDFADRLAAGGYTWDANLFHWHEEGAPHNEAAWAARVSRPLAIFAALE
ncbi:MAG: hypothetical protein EP330_03240 [Deltaproteobacteria bacterium]|nr:MAG: hypothetical protein EP330_03240 [Deltaproteobacteria bacterium]